MRSHAERGNEERRKIETEDVGIQPYHSRPRRSRFPYTPGRLVACQIAGGCRIKFYSNNGGKDLDLTIFVDDKFDYAAAHQPEMLSDFVR